MEDRHINLKPGTVVTIEATIIDIFYGDYIGTKSNSYVMRIEDPNCGFAKVCVGAEKIDKVVSLSLPAEPESGLALLNRDTVLKRKYAGTSGWFDDEGNIYQDWADVCDFARRHKYPIAPLFSGDEVNL